MSEFTRSKVSLGIDEEIVKIRKEAKSKGIPVILDESLNMLLLSVKMCKPKKILEIGTAVGMSGICMLNAAVEARLITVEQDEDSYNEAKANFKKFGVESRVRAILGDAGDVVRCYEPYFDFIFLDGAKARYYDYLPDLKRLLRAGGVLFADNVLFRGFVEMEKVPHSEMTIVRNMRAFIDDLVADKRYTVSLLDIGDGVLIAHKDF